MSCCRQGSAGTLCQRCLRGRRAAAGLSRSCFKCALPAAAPEGAAGPGVCVRVHFLHFLIEDLKSLSGQGGLRGGREGREGWSCGVCPVVLAPVGVRGGRWCPVPARCAPQLPLRARLCILLVFEQAPCLLLPCWNPWHCRGGAGAPHVPGLGQAEGGTEGTAGTGMGTPRAWWHRQL